MLKEFRDFINRGNVVDLAVGVIIGAAFGDIVKSAVAELIMPPIGLVLGGLNFDSFYLPLTKAVPFGLALEAAKAKGPVVAYGHFVTLLINFLIVAFCVFLLVQAVNKLRRAEAEKPKEPDTMPPDIALLTEIRDLLKPDAAPPRG